MIEESKKPRIVGDTLVIETQSVSQVYDAKYLVASLLVFVAKGDGNISGPESGEMVDLISEHFDISRAESLELCTKAMGDIADNPDFENLLRDLSQLLNSHEKEEVAVMMLKVVASDGRRDTEEMDKVRAAAEIIDISADVLHQAYDRYFEETQA